MEKLIVDIPHSMKFDDAGLYAFCAANRSLRVERNHTGQIVLMSPTGGFSSRLNARLIVALYAWNEQGQATPGEVFDSSGGFLLPSGAMRAPDAAWVSRSRWEALTEEEKEKFPPLCPDCVVEMRSPSDSLAELQAKMDEWIAAGCRLAWLIDPKAKTAWVYQPGQPVYETASPLDGGEVLPGFVLDLAVLLA
ncbi:MAG: Uma2 family endonuclease [Bacteroidia bacterium]|nr:Uma2 family endonuclease [Bacteroidia bacterium]